MTSVLYHIKVHRQEPLTRIDSSPLRLEEEVD